MLRCFTAFAVSLTVAYPNPASAAIVYVDADAAGANDGSSWSNAFTGLQPGLAIAQDGDTVRVAQGIYVAGDSREDTFSIPDGVRIVGGYAGDGEIDPDAFDPDAFVTVLSGDINGDDGPNFANDDENSFHVVTARNTKGGTLLRGLTISGGRADDDFTSVTEPNGVGGGIACINARLIIRDCIIENNRAESRGGGIGIQAVTPKPIHMLNCVIRGNTVMTSVGSAGGVSAGGGSTFTDCLFQDNVVPFAGSGGALSLNTGTIERCDFIDNTAAEDGGAIIASLVDIIDCTFTGNSCGIYGGAAKIGGSQNRLINCRFEDNSAGSGGGGLAIFSITSAADVIECDFIGNQASHSGAILNFGHLTLLNSDFLSNTTGVTFGSGGAGAVGCASTFSSLSAVNCLFSGNTSAWRGAAIGAAGTTSLVNCTIIGNEGNLDRASSPGGAVSVSGRLNLHNCILWDNLSAAATDEAQQITASDDSTIFRVRNASIQGWTGDLGGSHNNGHDPLLVDGDGGDNTYGTLDDDPRLGVGSPARNSGRNDLLPRDDFDLDGDTNVNERISEDLDGGRRIRQGTVDRGAFESTT